MSKCCLSCYISPRNFISTNEATLQARPDVALDNLAHKENNIEGNETHGLWAVRFANYIYW